MLGCVTEWGRDLLYIPRVKTKDRTLAFSVTAPAVWDSLAASVMLEGNIVSFRRRLKTYLFKAACPPKLPSTFVRPSTSCALFTITRLLHHLVFVALLIMIFEDISA